jgi:hypothetical protein
VGSTSRTRRDDYGILALFRGGATLAAASRPGEMGDESLTQDTSCPLKYNGQLACMRIGRC